MMKEARAAATGSPAGVTTPGLGCEPNQLKPPELRAVKQTPFGLGFHKIPISFRFIGDCLYNLMMHFSDLINNTRVC